VTSPEQFKALGHPMRHRLLFALGQQTATISQLAVSLETRKGNVAHHLKVLRDAGLVEVAGTRQVRGGTEQYYRRSARILRYTGEHSHANLETAFRAMAAEINAAEPDPLLILRYVRLTAEQAEEITATLTALSRRTEDAPADQPRYGLLLGLYRQQPATGQDARGHGGIA
jgi:DNA-binding transcriptional ArsR family regulator